MKIPNSKRIKNNLAYSLNINDSTIILERVYKRMFEATVVISDKMIRFGSFTSERVLKTLS